MEMGNTHHQTRWGGGNRRISGKCPSHWSNVFLPTSFVVWYKKKKKGTSKLYPGLDGGSGVYKPTSVLKGYVQLPRTLRNEWVDRTVARGRFLQVGLQTYA